MITLTRYTRDGECEVYINPSNVSYVMQNNYPNYEHLTLVMVAGTEIAVIGTPKEIYAKIFN